MPNPEACEFCISRRAALTMTAGAVGLGVQEIVEGATIQQSQDLYSFGPIIRGAPFSERNSAALTEALALLNARMALS